MTEPAPVDEPKLPPVEIRGGDRDEDFMPDAGLPPFAPGGLVTSGPCVPGPNGGCTCEDPE